MRTFYGQTTLYTVKLRYCQFHTNPTPAYWHIYYFFNEHFLTYLIYYINQIRLFSTNPNERMQPFFPTYNILEAWDRMKWDTINQSHTAPTYPKPGLKSVRWALLQNGLQLLLRCNIFVILLFNTHFFDFQLITSICNNFVIELTYFCIKNIHFSDFGCNFEVSNKTKPLKRQTKRHQRH